MITISKPATPRDDPIAAHVYGTPVVHEIPITPSTGCWDNTW
jgi:hypothetical protein